MCTDKSIWQSQSTTCIHQYKCRFIYTGNPKNKYNSLLLELSIFSSCLSEMVYETGCEIIYKKFKFLQKILQVFFCFGRSEYLKYK